MNKVLEDLVQRADSWPVSAQEELARIAREIEAELNAGTFHASSDELAGIDRGLRDSAEGRFADEDQVNATFAKHRGR